MQVENGEHAKRRLALAEARQRELEAELRSARAAADEAELRAHAERVRAPAKPGSYTHWCTLKDGMPRHVADQLWR
jgi:hypothetical protein